MTLFDNSTSRRLVALLFIAASPAIPANESVSALSPEQELAQESFITKQILIKLRGRTGSAVQDQALEASFAADAGQRLRVRLVRKGTSPAGETLFDLYRVDSSPARASKAEPNRLTLEEYRALIGRLKTDPNVSFVRSLTPGRVHYTPSDPGVSTMRPYLVEYPGINLLNAWDVSFQGPPVTVAVLDTGYLPHPEFSGRVLPGYNLSNGGRLQTYSQPQGTFYVQIDGATPIPDGRDPGDITTTKNFKWHGTKVSGIIMAAANGSGVVGVHPSARLLPIRITLPGGAMAPNVAASAMKWAAGLPVSIDGVPLPVNPNPARVINMSAGGDPSVYNRNGVLGCSDEYQDAINAVRAQGAIVVVSAGNDSSEVKNWQPANCNGVVVVAGSSIAGDLNEEVRSNYGVGVTLTAPASGIHSTSAILPASGALRYVNTYEDPDEIGGVSGTSFAAPLVSGALALMFSHRPQLTPEQAISILKQTATPPAPGSRCAQLGCGAGVLNVGAAMRKVNELYPATTCSLAASTSTVPAGGSVTFQISAAGMPSGSTGYWYGTKNGVTDEGGSTSVAVPSSSTHINYNGMAGTYRRHVKIFGPYGQLLCTTNTEQVVFSAPVTPRCWLTGPSVVEPGQVFTLNVGGANLDSSKTYYGYWYGTKNGVVDAQNQFDSGLGDHTFTNLGAAGVYTRRMDLRLGATTVCTTNTISITLR